MNQSGNQDIKQVKKQPMKSQNIDRIATKIMSQTPIFSIRFLKSRLSFFLAARKLPAEIFQNLLNFLTCKNYYQKTSCHIPPYKQRLP